MSWTSPEDLRSQVQRLWDSGRLLATIVDEIVAREGRRTSTPELLTEIEGAQELRSSGALGRGPARDGEARSPPTVEFPLALRFRKPAPRDLGNSFDQVRDWIRRLEARSRAAVGTGYDIEWEEASNRLLGRNAIPRRIVVPTRADALAMIAATDAADRFTALASQTTRGVPELGDWLRRNPLAALDEADSWGRILSVLEWFRRHPRSGLYVRQIDVAGVDTKFIEPRKALLAQLLDAVLPDDFIDPSCAGAAGFEQRYGLASKPALVRLRVLDRNLAIAGLADVTTRVDDLAQLRIAADRVFIVENEITGLAFPQREASILIFGSGYAIERLAALPWLRACDVHYWGDIDTHGFVMLDRLRVFLPDTRSMLMDRQTLLDHRALWSFEETPHVAPLSRLTSEELDLYDDLRLDRLGHGVRLEQERIPLRQLEAGLQSLDECPRDSWNAGLA